MSYFSQMWGVEVREKIVREFTSPDGTVDDNLAGLHEVRARMTEQEGRKTPAQLTEETAEAQRSLESEGWRVIQRGKSRTAA